MDDFSTTSPKDTKPSVGMVNTDKVANTALKQSESTSPEPSPTKKKGGNKRKFTHEYCLTCINYGRACSGREEDTDGCSVCRNPRKEKGEKLRDCLWADPDNGVFDYKQARAARKEAKLNNAQQTKVRRRTVSMKGLQTSTRQSEDNGLPVRLKWLDVVTPYSTAEDLQNGMDNIRTFLHEDPALPVYNPLPQQEPFSEPDFAPTLPLTRSQSATSSFNSLSTDDREFEHFWAGSKLCYKDIDVVNLNNTRKAATNTCRDNLQPDPQPEENSLIYLDQDDKSSINKPSQDQPFGSQPRTLLPAFESPPRAKANIVSLPIVTNPRYIKPRPLDLSGRKSRKWEKSGKKVTCITGSSWSLPAWRPKD